MFFTSLFGNLSKKFLKRVKPIVRKINSLSSKYRTWTKDQIVEQIANYRSQVQLKQKTLDQILPEVFAITKEACRRSKGMQYFDVQIMGAIAIHEGKIAEMKTGEGKTLVASLPAVLNALDGKGVRIVTFNDYLTYRDWQYCKPIFDYLELTSGCVIEDSSHSDKKEAYARDITYCSKDQLVFDYLRHNMRTDSYGEYFPLIDGDYHNHFAIIDEVDAVLIDNARTPLIISGFSGISTDLYKRINPIIATLEPTDYNLGKNKRIVFTEYGAIKIEDILKKQGIIEGNLYSEKNLEVLHVTMNLLKAHKAFIKNIDYIVSEIEPREAIIIGEMTGREEIGRRFSDGLHQAIEAKEGIEIRDETVTRASMTYPNYFRMYKKLSGMTGTATSDKNEFEEIYNLQIIEIPTNKPIARIDHKNAYIYSKILHMYEDVIALIKEKHLKGQPVLACTTSIEESELLASLLEEVTFIKARVLNARTHKQEADIIAQAGRPGMVTISTIMAGRGTDILLGGNEAVALEAIGKNIPDYELIRQKITDQYKKDRQLVKEVGGLVVIIVGTPESEKAITQFRGRAGRQGDRGESFFFASLQDYLIRPLFEERINSLLIENLYYGEDTRFVCSERSDQIIKYVHIANKTNAFESRKNLLKYDDVINEQRTNVYSFRDYLINSSAGERVARKLLSFSNQSELSDSFNGVDNNTIQSLILYCFDKVWYEHVIKMENLKKTIHISSYEQKEPTQEYKRLAYEMFKKTLFEFQKTFVEECKRNNPFEMSQVDNTQRHYEEELSKLSALFEEMKDSINLEELKKITSKFPEGFFSDMFQSFEENTTTEETVEEYMQKEISLEVQELQEIKHSKKHNINPEYAKNLTSDMLQQEIERNIEQQPVHLGAHSLHYSTDPSEIKDVSPIKRKLSKKIAKTPRKTSTSILAKKKTKKNPLKTKLVENSLRKSSGKVTKTKPTLKSTKKIIKTQKALKPKRSKNPTSRNRTINKSDETKK